MKKHFAKSSILSVSFAFLVSGVLGYTQLDHKSTTSSATAVASAESLPLFTNSSTPHVVPTMSQCRRLQMKTATTKKRPKPEKKTTHHQPTAEQTAITHAAPITHKSAAPVVQANAATSNSTDNHVNDNLYWLSRVIEAEAGGENYQAKLAVGDVILNRTHSPDYPSTVYGVIFERAYGVYEFTSVENGWIYHTPSQSSLDAAEAVLNGQNIVPNALVFYNKAQTPAKSWVLSQPVVTVIGNLTFAQ